MRTYFLRLSISGDVAARASKLSQLNAESTFQLGVASGSCATLVKASLLLVSLDDDDEVAGEVRRGGQWHRAQVWRCCQFKQASALRC